MACFVIAGIISHHRVQFLMDPPVGSDFSTRFYFFWEMHGTHSIVLWTVGAIAGIAGLIMLCIDIRAALKDPSAT